MSTNLSGYAPVCHVNLACWFWELLDALQPCGNVGSCYCAQITVAEAVMMAESTCFALGDKSTLMQASSVAYSISQVQYKCQRISVMLVLL